MTMKYWEGIATKPEPKPAEQHASNTYKKTCYKGAPVPTVAVGHDTACLNIATGDSTHRVVFNNTQEIVWMSENLDDNMWDETSRMYPRELPVPQHRLQEYEDGVVELMIVGTRKGITTLLFEDQASFELFAQQLHDVVRN